MHGEGSMIHASGLTFEGMWTGGRPTGWFAIKEASSSSIRCILTRPIYPLSAEAVAIRVVGKPQQDVVQGRPFGFEVECVSLDGERVLGKPKT